ncbi:hypothetical protein Ddye_023144 [Dipteronia dyeriana]|uniref:Uncharacterized protein n=1 Tax=Dipteronia dyeriana TaxID=168575 RepID=A0AAD9TSJ8_9ROSI|nr:hypothetical protein Ddye_023144 [Dipteronia dyeriana]
MIDDTNWTTGLGIRVESIFKDLQYPVASMRVRLHPRRMEDFRCEVSAKEAPSRAICGGVDVVLVTNDNFGDASRFGTVSKRSAVLDQGLVSERAIGDEYGGVGADVEGDDGAELGVKRLDVRFKFKQRFSEQEKVADDGKNEGAWWE